MKNKLTITKLVINEEEIDLPFPVDIIPFFDNSGTIGSSQHRDIVMMGQVIVELIKGFMDRFGEGNIK